MIDGRICGWFFGIIKNTCPTIIILVNSDTSRQWASDDPFQKLWMKPSELVQFDIF